MILGLSTSSFTALHVVITLIAIASGLVVMFGMLGSHRLKAWTAIFWLMTVLTSVTGFLFPINGFTPGLGVGVIATVIFVIGLVALYVQDLAGSWRWIYAITAVISLYLNVFVLIVQSFEKVGFLNPHAPTIGPPFAEPQNTQFAIAQVVALLFFVVMGILAAIRFRPAPQPI